MKKILTLCALAMMAATTVACDKGFHEDCVINDNYEIECDAFDPSLSTP